MAERVESGRRRAVKPNGRRRLLKMAGTVQKQVVYLETSFVSVLASRATDDASKEAMRSASKEWWERARARFVLRTSELTLEEAAKGDPGRSRIRRELLLGVAVFPVTSAVELLAWRLLDAEAIPFKAKADAFHVAIAAVGGADILLTWNCKHISNREKASDIKKIIEEAGYAAPRIATPARLLEDTNENQ